MAQQGANRSGTRSSGKSRPRRRPLDDEGIIPILARAVREVENQAARGKVNAQNRIKFQVAALLVREEKARVKDDTAVTAAERAEVLKRLDGLAAIMAKTAARDTSLIALLAPEAKISDSAKGCDGTSSSPVAPNLLPKTSSSPKRNPSRAPNRPSRWCPSRCATPSSLTPSCLRISPLTASRRAKSRVS